MPPAILDRLVRQLQAKGYEKSSATAIATKTLQKSGNLKPGTQEATAQGKYRGKLSPEAREKDRNRGGRLARNSKELAAKKGRKNRRAE